MDKTCNNLNSFFAEQLESLDCNADTRAYIVGVLDSFKNTACDFSTSSITLLYSEARYRQDFHTFQRVADWLLFCSTLFPESLNDASPDYYCSIARLSYYSCYKIIKSWKLFENLSDEFVVLTNDSRKLLLNSSIRAF
jgi:hypothetical protein